MPDEGSSKSERDNRPSPGRFAVLNAFIDEGISSSGIGPSTALVWLVAYRHADQAGQVSVSIREIARAVGLSTRTVITALNELRSKGLLKCVKRGSKRSGASLHRISPLPRPDRVNMKPASSEACFT